MNSIENEKFVEKVAISIVREYLLKKDLPLTARALSKESPSGGYCSRAELAKDLQIQPLLKANKSFIHPFESILEVLIHNYLETGKWRRDNPNVNGCNEEIRDTSSPPPRIRRESNGEGRLMPNADKKSVKLYPDLHIENLTLEDQEASLRNEHRRTQITTTRNATHESIQDEDGDLHESPSTVREDWLKSSIENRSSRTSSFENPATLFTARPCPNPLEYKQNILAQVSLSKQEEKVRQENADANYRQEQLDSLQDLDLDNPQSLATSTTMSGSSAFASSQLEDFEDEDADLAIAESRLEEMNQFRRQRDNETTNSIVKTLTSAECRDLKLIIFGKRPNPLDWEGQGFVFNSKIPFGLVQKRGGPCGVLAAVQAILLRNLMFGSECYEDQIFNDLTQLDESMTVKMKTKRIPALVAALTEIIWRCGKTSIGAGAGHGPDSHAHGPTICFNIAIGGQYRVFDDIEDLRKYIQFHIQQFDCITIVYSIVLSRGIHNVKSDMDFNSPLLGQHGYCTQELVNLLIIGTATSNAFDNEIILGEQVLKGICAQADIGLLSLFEHYDSCRVGSYLKNPRFPLWIVCSESHFSLLFSNDLRLTKSKRVNHDTFDLYYYDGLASQDHLVRLTIKLNGYSNPKPIVDPCLNGNNNIPEDLIPPLEKCIRTKWKNAGVDWNDTEPIL